MLFRSLVVGETARAANFSLNGYKRKTNPLLTRKDVIYFNNAHSCGTATAVSLPCMFSKFGRKAYSDYKGKAYENLLDVLSHAGVNVFWRENNTGCKGVCKRVKYQDMSNSKLKGVCKSGECFDAVLLHNLQQHINTLKTDAVIVLHQNGSHGPTYYRRYPKRFEKFTPVCATNQLQKCTDEQLINVYDNTILYTDYILENVIDLLKNNISKNIDSAAISIIKKEKNKVVEVGRTHYKFLNDNFKKLYIYAVGYLKKNKLEIDKDRKSVV